MQITHVYQLFGYGALFLAFMVGFYTLGPLIRVLHDIWRLLFLVLYNKVRPVLGTYSKNPDIAY